MFQKFVSNRSVFFLKGETDIKLSSDDLFVYLNEQKVINNGKFNAKKFLYDAKFYFHLIDNFAVTPQNKALTILLYSLLLEGNDEVEVFKGYLGKTKQVVKLLTVDVSSNEKGVQVLEKVALNLRSSNNSSIYTEDNKSLFKIVDAILNGEKLIGDCLGLSSLYSFILFSRGEEVGFIRTSFKSLANQECFEERHMLLKVEDKPIETTRKDLKPVGEEEVYFRESNEFHSFLSEMFYAFWLKSTDMEEKYKLMQIFRDDWEIGNNINKRIKHLKDTFFNFRQLVDAGIGLFDNSKQIFSIDQEKVLRFRYSMAEFINIMKNDFSEEEIFLLDDDTISVLVTLISLFYKNIKNFQKIFNKYSIEKEINEIYNDYFLKLYRNLESRFINACYYCINNYDYAKSLEFFYNFWTKASENLELVDHKRLSLFFEFFIINLPNKILDRYPQYKGQFKEILSINKQKKWVTDKKLLRVLEVQLK